MCGLSLDSLIFNLLSRCQILAPGFKIGLQHHLQERHQEAKEHPDLNQLDAGSGWQRVRDPD